MKTICEDIKSHVSEVLVEWETLVREEPWYSLPADHRIDNLPDVTVGLVEASLCNPQLLLSDSLQAKFHHLNQIPRGDRLSDVPTEAALLEAAIGLIRCRYSHDGNGRGIRVRFQQTSRLPSIQDRHM